MAIKGGFDANDIAAQILSALDTIENTGVKKAEDIGVSIGQAVRDGIVEGSKGLETEIGKTYKQFQNFVRSMNRSADGLKLDRWKKGLGLAESLMKDEKYAHRVAEALKDVQATFNGTKVSGLENVLREFSKNAQALQKVSMPQMKANNAGATKKASVEAPVVQADPTPVVRAEEKKQEAIDDTTEAIIKQGKAVEKVTKRVPKMESIIKRYNRLMSDIGYEEFGVGYGTAQDDAQSWTVKDMVEEARRFLDFHYEPGHVLYEDRNEGPEGLKRWKSETEKLKRFIATYEPYVDIIQTTVGEVQQATTVTEKQVEALHEQASATESAAQAQEKLNKAQKQSALSDKEITHALDVKARYTGASLKGKSDFIKAIKDEWGRGNKSVAAKLFEQYKARFPGGTYDPSTDRAFGADWSDNYSKYLEQANRHIAELDKRLDDVVGGVIEVQGEFRKLSEIIEESKNAALSGIDLDVSRFIQPDKYDYTDSDIAEMEAHLESVRKEAERLKDEALAAQQAFDEVNAIRSEYFGEHLRRYEQRPGQSPILTAEKKSEWQEAIKSAWDQGNKPLAAKLYEQYRVKFPKGTFDPSKQARFGEDWKDNYEKYLEQANRHIVELDTMLRNMGTAYGKYMAYQGLNNFLTGYSGKNDWYHYAGNEERLEKIKRNKSVNEVVMEDLDARKEAAHNKYVTDDPVVAQENLNRAVAEYNRRQAIANELLARRDEMIDAMNDDDDSKQYLFDGYESPAFAIQKASGKYSDASLDADRFAITELEEAIRVARELGIEIDEAYTIPDDKKGEIVNDLLMRQRRFAMQNEKAGTPEKSQQIWDAEIEQQDMAQKEIEAVRLEAEQFVARCKEIQAQEVFDGVDYDKLISELSTVLAKLKEVAEQRDITFGAYDPEWEFETTKSYLEYRKRVAEAEKEGIVYHAGVLGNVGRTMKSRPLGSVVPEKHGDYNSLTGLYTTPDWDGFIGNEWSGAPISTIDINQYKLFDARRKSIALQVHQFFDDLNGTIYGYQEYFDDEAQEMAKTTDVKSIESLYAEFKNIFVDAEISFEQFAAFIKESAEIVKGHDFKPIDYVDIDEGIGKSYSTSALQGVSKEVFNSDSFSTRLMKMLGYEGLDTRGSGLDSTYKGGTVIFDVKPESIISTDGKWSELMSRHGVEIDEKSLEHEEKRRQLAFETAEAYSRQEDAVTNISSTDAKAKLTAIQRQAYNYRRPTDNNKALTERQATLTERLSEIESIRKEFPELEKACASAEKAVSGTLDMLQKSVASTNEQADAAGELLVAEQQVTAEKKKQADLGSDQKSGSDLLNDLMDSQEDAWQKKLEKERQEKLQAQKEAEEANARADMMAMQREGKAKGQAYSGDVYHGSGEQLNDVTFDPKIGDGLRRFGLGAYFTEELDKAAQFGDNIVKKSVDLKNVFMLTEDMVSDLDDLYAAMGKVKPDGVDHKTAMDELSSYLLDMNNIEPFTNRMKKIGYDGMFVQDGGAKELVVYDEKYWQNWTTATVEQLNVEKQITAEKEKQNELAAGQNKKSLQDVLDLINKMSAESGDMDAFDKRHQALIDRVNNLTSDADYDQMYDQLIADEERYQQEIAETARIQEERNKQVYEFAQFVGPFMGDDKYAAVDVGDKVKLYESLANKILEGGMSISDAKDQLYTSMEELCKQLVDGDQKEAKNLLDIVPDMSDPRVSEAFKGMKIKDWVAGNVQPDARKQLEEELYKLAQTIVDDNTEAYNAQLAHIADFIVENYKARELKEENPYEEVFKTVSLTYTDTEVAEMGPRLFERAKRLLGNKFAKKNADNKHAHSIDTFVDSLAYNHPGLLSDPDSNEAAANKFEEFLDHYEHWKQEGKRKTRDTYLSDSDIPGIIDDFNETMRVQMIANIQEQQDILDAKTEVAQEATDSLDKAFQRVKQASSYAVLGGNTKADFEDFAGQIAKDSGMELGQVTVSRDSTNEMTLATIKLINKELAQSITYTYDIQESADGINEAFLRSSYAVGDASRALENARKKQKQDEDKKAHDDLWLVGQRKKLDTEVRRYTNPDRGVAGNSKIMSTETSLDKDAELTIENLANHIRENIQKYLSGVLTDEAKQQIVSDLEILENEIKVHQMNTYSSTAMKSSNVKTNKQVYEQYMRAFRARAEKSGVLPEMEETIDALDTELSEVKDAQGLNTFIDNLRVARNKLQAEVAELTTGLNYLKDELAVFKREEKAWYDMYARIENINKDGNLGADLQSKFNNYAQLAFDLNRIINELKDGDYEGTQDDKINEFYQMAQKVKDARVEIDGMLKQSQKLDQVMANMDVFDRKDLDPSELKNLQQTMLSFAASVEDGVFKFKGFNKAGTEMYGMLERSDGTIKKVTVALRQSSDELYMYGTNANRADNEWQDFKDTLANGTKNLVGMYVGFQEGVQAIRSGVEAVKQIDLAMTELKKVTDATDDSYREFLEDAGRTSAVIGSTVSDFTEASATFARLGYDLDEASSMAETAIIYKNVAD